MAWFWQKFRNNYNNRLTTIGANQLYDIAKSKIYDIRQQPENIQKRIIEMLRTNYTGNKYADELEEIVIADQRKNRDSQGALY